MKFKHQTIILLFISICFTLALILRSHTEAVYNKQLTKDDIYYLPEAQWLKFFSCGYNEAAADLVWIKFILYFASSPKALVQKGERLTRETALAIESRVEQIEKNYSLEYVKTVTALDPRFHEAYLNGAKLTMYQHGVISKRTIEMAIEILEEGIKNFQSSGRIHFDLGFLLYFEIEAFTVDDDELEQFRQRGVSHFKKASMMPDAPQYTARLADSLLDKHSMDEMLVEYLQHQLAMETDPMIRSHLEVKLIEKTGDLAQHEIKQMQQLHNRWQKNWSYIPFDLFTLLYDPQNQRINL